MLGKFIALNEFVTRHVLLSSTLQELYCSARYFPLYSKCYGQVSQHEDQVKCCEGWLGSELVLSIELVLSCQRPSAADAPCLHYSCNVSMYRCCRHPSRLHLYLQSSLPMLKKLSWHVTAQWLRISLYTAFILHLF